MSILIELVVAAFILIGSVFLFVGSFGLFKLPDTMRRLHAPTKATTLGIGALLIASMLYFALLRQAPGIHEILITLFLFLTAPVVAQMIAKAHVFRDKETRKSLSAAKDSGWATLTEPH
ncbi:MAG: Na+/H+ antiporter subunit G [Pseudolabrys sp.]|nr:Na+/H+ antiporter subunit G [Pseudolabrys sp.]